uniref:RRM domain-containing protein n=1 Tax=Lepeophtheirus salmonis TaxID=72036 RepID=A0A0K2V974_LEPSM
MNFVVNFLFAITIQSTSIHVCHQVSTERLFVNYSYVRERMLIKIQLLLLMGDWINLKEAVEYDKNLGRGFRFVDYGEQCDLGYEEEKANGGLVCMLVGD